MSPKSVRINRHKTAFEVDLANILRKHRKNTLEICGSNLHRGKLTARDLHKIFDSLYRDHWDNLCLKCKQFNSLFVLRSRPASALLMKKVVQKYFLNIRRMVRSILMRLAVNSFLCKTHVWMHPLGVDAIWAFLWVLVQKLPELILAPHFLAVLKSYNIHRFCAKNISVSFLFND